MSNMAMMQPELATPVAAACSNATGIILSGRSIMHRRPFTVKQIIACSRQCRHWFLIDSF
jgi:hypothetical protein